MTTSYRLNADAARAVAAFLHGRGLGVADWDAVVFADGSGSNWDRACGWAAVAVLKDEVLVAGGAMDHGTVNVAEVLAVLQPLTWLAERHARAPLPARRRLLRTHVFTDSQYVRDRLNGGDKLSRPNAGFWACVDAVCRQNLQVTAHWLERNSTPCHAWADTLSKSLRQYIEAYPGAGRGGGLFAANEESTHENEEGQN